MIVTAIIELAHGLGMNVVAEGVETPAQLDELSRLDCDLCQGYHFARPMPPSDLDAMLRHGAAIGEQRLPQ
jgi:EAL domain-containing protein (putative c-di-GMP-specific phosphodiesterase class I)